MEDIPLATRFEASLVLSGVGDAIGYKVGPFFAVLFAFANQLANQLVFRTARGSLLRVETQFTRRQKNWVRFLGAKDFRSIG
jgi:hypothetical protein